MSPTVWAGEQWTTDHAPVPHGEADEDGRICAFIEVGVVDFEPHFEPHDPDTLVHAIERFDRDVVRELAA